MTKLFLCCSFVILLLQTYYGYRVIKTSRDIDEVESIDIEEVQSSEESERDLRKLSYQDHRVESLPGLVASEAQNLVHYAGYINVDNKNDGNLFYWLFHASQDAANKPLIIWLNGGPGCSSMDGLFLELGPLHIMEDDQTITINRYSWHNIANILFIDQPVGTGLSYTKSREGLARDDERVNSHFYNFLQNFFQLHDYFTQTIDGKVYRSSRNIILAGESHAGHYIPSMVHYILRRNNDLLASQQQQIYLNIAGMVLGNPWMDPFHQYSVAEFSHSMGLISYGQLLTLQDQEHQCQQILTQQKQYRHNTCLSLLDKVMENVNLPGASHLLMYDTRKFVRYANIFPPGHEKVERYLNRRDVRIALHAGNTIKFVECADPPYDALAHQDGLGIMPEFIDILNSFTPDTNQDSKENPLENHIEILIYAGQYDLICNHINLEKVLDNMLTWKNIQSWHQTRPNIYLIDKRPVGIARALENLLYLTIYDAGHMVPMDVPRVAFEMMNNFVNNRKALHSSNVNTGASAMTVGSSKVNIHGYPYINYDYTGNTCTNIRRSSYGRNLQRRLNTSNATVPNHDKNQKKSQPSQSTKTTTASPASPSSGHTPPKQSNSSHVSNIEFYPAIAHVHAYLNNSVLVRVRVHHAQQHQHTYYNTQKVAFSAQQQLAIENFHLVIHRIAPATPGSSSTSTSNAHSATSISVTNGAIESRVLDVDGHIFHNSHQMTDILITGLISGQEYGLQMDYHPQIQEHAGKSDTALQSILRKINTINHRVHRLTVGCVSAEYGQCCHHGECRAPDERQTVARCHCDSGYQGDFCQEYQVTVSAAADTNKQPDPAATAATATAATATAATAAESSYQANCPAVVKIVSPVQKFRFEDLVSHHSHVNTNKQDHPTPAQSKDVTTPQLTTSNPEQLAPSTVTTHQLLVGEYCPQVNHSSQRPKNSTYGGGQQRAFTCCVDVELLLTLSQSAMRAWTHNWPSMHELLLKDFEESIIRPVLPVPPPTANNHSLRVEGEVEVAQIEMSLGQESIQQMKGISLPQQHHHSQLTVPLLLRLCTNAPAYLDRSLQLLTTELKDPHSNLKLGILSSKLYSEYIKMVRSPTNERLPAPDRPDGSNRDSSSSTMNPFKSLLFFRRSSSSSYDSESFHLSDAIFTWPSLLLAVLVLAFVCRYLLRGASSQGASVGTSHLTHTMFSDVHGSQQLHHQQQQQQHRRGSAGNSRLRGRGYSPEKRHYFEDDEEDKYKSNYRT